MISASDFRTGVTFEMDGNVMQVVEFQHVKPGKGAAFVRVKMRNVISGSVTETTFNPSDKFRRPTWSARIWNISITTGISIILWTPKATSRSRSTRMF